MPELHAADRPVVMFALEWCEFSWSIRKLLNRMKVPYHSVDLDSTSFQRDDLGGRVRAALRAHTGINTIPQVFVGGRFIGGCTEVLDACRDGRFQAMLEEHGLAPEPLAVDPYSFYPKWVQPR